MADTKTVPFRPTVSIEGGKELQRVNMSTRQLNKVLRMLQEAPDAAFVGHVDGLTITISKEPPPTPQPAPAKRKYTRKAPAATAGKKPAS